MNTYLHPRYNSGILANTIRILPRSEIAHILPRSSPAMEQKMPKRVMKMPRIRTPLIKDLFEVILLAAISEKLKKPITQVNANRQKQMVIRKITILSKMPVPGVSEEIGRAHV